MELQQDASSSSWIRVDAATGDSQVIDLDSFHLPACVLRQIDPSSHLPSRIFGTEKAIVVNLEHIRCIITFDEVLLPNSGDNQYVVKLRRRLKDDHSPFEIKALQLALQPACTTLDTQVQELEIEAKISTFNLEGVRRLKHRVVAITRRVQKVRDEIYQLINDGNVAEMYRSVRTRSSENVNELVVLLESYFSGAVRNLKKLTSLKERIDDAEDSIKSHLDNDRNKIKQFTMQLCMWTVTFVSFSGLFAKNLEKNNQLNPIWNEHFDFTVEDPNTQHFTIRVFDDEGVQAFEVIGCGQVAIKDLEPGKVKDIWIKLVKDLQIIRRGASRFDGDVERSSN